MDVPSFAAFQRCPRTLVHGYNLPDGRPVYWEARRRSDGTLAYSDPSRPRLEVAPGLGD